MAAPFVSTPFQRRISWVDADIAVVPALLAGFERKDKRRVLALSWGRESINLPLLLVEISTIHDAVQINRSIQQRELRGGRR
ncbi:hypothetical protein CRG98_046144 [Punica granatum]|uniref:Uncharacterized protein n=1 Tax=Punica granatum TaxID=22663 RepID=A0A2I0HP07_PUNGR|nr:hypothetical protein CRG98_046144 [Punica granatum]